MAGIFETLIREDDKVISIVGAGGKTSLMFHLARAFQQQGLHVISTTTTRILKPTPLQTGGLALYEQKNFYDQLQNCLHMHGHATVAQALLPTGDKLAGISASLVEELLTKSSAQRIVIEADGARQLSFKAPGDSEPVVPQNTDVFISVLGLDIIGNPLTEDNVFRAELVAERTGIKIGDVITPIAVARLVTHPMGLLKGCPQNARCCLFLNKMDTQDGEDNARKIINAVRQQQGTQPDILLAASVQQDVCYLVNGD